MDVYRFVKAIQTVWPSINGQVSDLGLNKSGTRSFRVAFEVETKLILLYAMVGKRNGIKCLLVVIDPSKPSLLERFRFIGRIPEGEGRLLPLSRMRERILNGESVETVCREEMLKAIETIQARPELIRAAMLTDQGSNSIETFRGGLPGLGHSQ